MISCFKNGRNFLKVGLDIIAIFGATICALYIRMYGTVEIHALSKYFSLYVTLFILIYMFTKTEKKNWSFANSFDVLTLVYINCISAFGVIAIFSIFTRDYSRVVVFLILNLSIFFQLGIRFMFRLNRVRKMYFDSKDRKTAIVYGAGSAGVSLVRESINNKNFSYRIMGIIDDDPKMKETSIYRKPILGNFYDLESVIGKNNIDAVIIAIPSIDKSRVEEIVKEIRDIEENYKKAKKIEIKILPKLDELLLEEGMLSQVRDVSIDDLLGREQVLVNGESIMELIKDRTIFVTGGAGSIGSELVRQIAKHSPKKLIAADVNENDLYFLELEIKRIYPNLDYQSEICNIREGDKVDFLFNKYSPNIVFHAAAHKHVPLMEHNPEESVKNNIFGTKNVAEAATKYEADRFVLISTDKAVNPTNIMGATKRACELVIEDLNRNSTYTKFMAVRFGNVLGSNGSVIPIFKELISQGKNLTITHPDITRYFMTIPEAAQLVIEAGSLGQGGEVFILDMGKPVKILDLAKKMIELSGADVDIEIVGLRPGEKLYEELLYDVNSAEKTANKKIFIARLKEENINLAGHIEELKEAIKNPITENIKEIMKRFVLSYKEPEHHKKS